MATKSNVARKSTTTTKPRAKALKIAELTPAQKAWATRQAQGDDGSEAALKAWETRRANIAAAEREAAKAARSKAKKKSA